MVVEPAFQAIGVASFLSFLHHHHFWDASLEAIEGFSGSCEFLLCLLERKIGLASPFPDPLVGGIISLLRRLLEGFLKRFKFLAFFFTILG